MSQHLLFLHSPPLFPKTLKTPSPKTLTISSSTNPNNLFHSPQFSSFSHIKPYLQSQLNPILNGWLCSAFSVFCLSAAVPKAAQIPSIITSVKSNRAVSDGLTLATLVCARSAANYLQHVFLWEAALGASFRIRRYVFERVVERDLGFFEGSRGMDAGDVAHRIASETDDIADMMFSLLNVDSQAVNDHIESPKAIPDVNRITKDQFSDDKDLKKSYDSFRDNNSSVNFPKKFVASSGFPLFGYSGIPQPDFSSNGSLVLEIGRINGESVSGIDGPKPVLGKQPVRAKVPFEKGYSQMDWLKLTRTHPDLAGLKGETNKRLITMDEVKKHKTEGSIWTVLKGRVYNLSPYMKFHPGGVDMLMMAAGKDCTSLFNKHHPWVNSEFLLEKCLVGLLEADT